jgi:hypothetical protein
LSPKNAEMGGQKLYETVSEEKCEKNKDVERKGGGHILIANGGLN